MTAARRRQLRRFRNSAWPKLLAGSALIALSWFISLHTGF